MYKVSILLNSSVYGQAYGWGPIVSQVSIDIYGEDVVDKLWSYRADMTINATLPGPRANMDYRTDMPCNTTLAM